MIPGSTGPETQRCSAFLHRSYSSLRLLFLRFLHRILRISLPMAPSHSTP
ncbi:hypothetical protein Syun_027238 [Stephania yunnanensis]|uniref:Uncharacterized protein n=1 Tax=Stephania yunnanensis TaxID=152371 RepID=A0AAP0EKC1_9MAGN